VVCLCLAWLGVAATSAAAAATPDEPPPEVDLPKGDATETLPALTARTGLQLIYRSDTVRGVVTQPVRGRLTPPAALARMLAGTPLAAVPDDASGAYAVIRHPGAASAASPASRPSDHPPPLSMSAKKPFPIFAHALLSLGLFSTSELDAQLAPAARAPDDVVTLSPFSVEASRDVGYVATESLAGGRLSTPLKDTGVAITVLTREFLDDIAANNFLEAADWAPNSNSAYSASGPQIFNDYQVNFRSMGAGFQSRNYFRWYVNSDIYNTSRIDFARGPNSVVFGDAGVGGIANVSSKRAVKTKSHEVSYRWNSFDGHRATVDFNQALNDRLYLRFAAVYDHSDDWVDMQRVDREGAFLTATYRFNPRTELRGELEWGQVDRVVSFFPFDNFSNWDGTTVVTAPLAAGNFGGGVTRFAADTLIFVPGMPQLGIQNWRNFGQTSGTVRQLLNRPLEHAPASNPTISRLSLSFQSPEALVHQPYHVGAFYLEHQAGDRLFLEVAGNFQEQFRDVIQHFAQSITIDVNQFLPDGRANPNFRQRYTQDQRRQSDQANTVYELRGSAAYLLEHRWTRQRLLFSAGQRWDSFFNDAYTNVRTNGTDPRLNQAANRIDTRRYEDNLGAGLALAPAVDSASGIRTKYARLGGTYNDNELTYLQFAASGSWLRSGRLKTLAAVRRDFLNIERANARLDPVTFEWIGYTGETNDPKVNVTTLSGGAVFELTKSVNAFVNYAESFQPATAAVAIDGGGIPPLESQGLDFGLKASFLDGRLSGSVAYYLNEETNRRTTGSATEINRIWDDLLSSNEVQASYSDIFSQKGRGLELELTANPTRNWRLMFNVSFPKTEQIDGFAMTKAYYARHIATWRTGAAAQTDTAIRTRILNDIAAIENRIGSFAEGRELNGAYQYTANAYANYTVTDGTLRGLGLGGGVQFRGRRLVINAPTGPFDYIYCPSYYLVTAALSYRLKVWNQPLRLQLNVSNLLDDELVQPTRYGTYTVNGAARFVPDRYYIQPPRRYTLTATYTF
jgi:iron complex outermembrane receptor protein